jgi:LPS-assembly protein
MLVPRAARARLAPVLVACLASMPVARGQVSQEAAAPGDVRLKLRAQEKLLPSVAPGTTEELPVFLEADRIEGYQDRELEAIGSVVVRRRGQVLHADRLKYSIQDNAVTATGHVRVDRLGDVVTGDQAYYDLDDSTGYIDHPTYRFREFGARGAARRLLILDRDTYRAERATYTNCDVGDDDWYLHVDRLDLDRLRDVGIARHTTVYFKGLPVLYSPWIDFPLTSRRKTGFLPPQIGTTGNSGFEVAVPFYWNMAPNRDYTLAPRVLSRRGLLLNNEFRYLEPKFNGEARFEYLPDDRIKEDNRWGYSFQHSHRITDRLSATLDVQGVSDDTYFVDLSDKIAATSQTNLPREAALTYNGEWWTLLSRAQTFQTLQDPLAPVVEPYARLPQLLLEAARHNLRGLDLDFSGEVVNFDHPSLITSWRQVYYPSLSLPYRNRLFYLTPKAGFHYTHYSFPDSGQADETRSLPIFSVDSGMSFDRAIALGGRDFRQTLEPRLYYVYIPFRRQDQLPLFDTAEADFNLAQIFTENQFSGSDRINDANQITAAVTSRLIDPASGSEWIRGTLGQRYYFKEQEVTLGTEPRATNRSDLLALVSGSLTRAWSANFGLQFNVDDSQSKKLNVGLRYRPQLGKVLNLGYRFTRDQLEQVDVSTQWPLSSRWNGLARWNYSLRDDSLLEGLLGFEYNAGCWSARIVAHRFVTSVDQVSTSLFFQLELTGLSRVGNNPLEVLRQNIGGYTPAPRRRAPAEDYYPGMDESVTE